MGLSASQARFLQLTARKGDLEYEVQQINLQRLKLSDISSAASIKYQDAVNNRKMVFSFNGGEGVKSVDISYNNYKNYMNQQMDGLITSQAKYYLVSSSGNKLIVSSEEEMNEMIERYTTRTPVAQIQAAKAEVEAAGEDTSGIDNYTLSLSKIDLTSYESETRNDENGNPVEYHVAREFSADDFLIVDDLDNTETFQRAIKEGIYYFAKYQENEETKEMEFNPIEWATLGGGAISEEYDKSDDAAAQAEYEATQSKVQNLDRKLEMELDRLETERQAITTEMESVKKVVDDNVEKTFNIFS
ncbi:MAG: hypothetical protein IJB79_06585 [Candidatus Gastranaerophilales bacterium]|nr:hypothetical protein [Candidatus Gastranaerophilales bacterium]